LLDSVSYRVKTLSNIPRQTEKNYEEEHYDFFYSSKWKTKINLKIKSSSETRVA
jgi:hypothetical protein